MSGSCMSFNILPELKRIEGFINSLSEDFSNPLCSNSKITVKITSVDCLIYALDKKLTSSSRNDPPIADKFEELRALIQIFESELKSRVEHAALPNFGMPVTQAASSSQQAPFSLISPLQHQSPYATTEAETGSSHDLPKPFVTLRQLIPEDLIHIKDNISQISCLDQNTRPFGGHKCGIHALWNAISVLAVINGYDIGPNIDIFHSLKLYENFESLFLKISPILNDDVHDVNEPDIREVWNQICAQEALPFPGSSPSNWQKNDLSIFHIRKNHENEQPKALLRGLDETSLDFFINLLEISQRPGPFSHVFIVGAENNKLIDGIPAGHWTTLIYEKDANQNVFWTGLNSRRDLPKDFCKNIPLLEGAMKSIHELAYREYVYVLGDDLKRKFNGFLPLEYGGYELIDPTNLSIFYDPSKTEARYLQVLDRAAQFMSKMGWLDPNSPQHLAYEEDIRYVRVILDFYRQTHHQDPQFIQIDGLMNPLIL